MGWENIQLKVDSLKNYNLSSYDIDRIPAVYFHGDYVDAKGLEAINAIKTRHPLFAKIDNESKGEYSNKKNLQSPVSKYQTNNQPLLSFNSNKQNHAYTGGNPFKEKTTPQGFDLMYIS